MATGQIGFFRPKQVKKILVEKRVNEIINRLNKTKEEKFPDLAEEKMAWDKEQKRKEKAALQEKVRIRDYVFILSVHRGRKKRGLRKRRGRKKNERGSSMKICMVMPQRGRLRKREGRIMIQRKISGDVRLLPKVLIFAYGEAFFLFFDLE